MYSITQTRPDIAFVLSVISRYSYNPSPDNATLVKYAFKYYGRTQNVGLLVSGETEGLRVLWNDDSFKQKTTRPGGQVNVTVWADSDWKGDKATGRSTFGYIVQLGKATVAWKSKRTDRVMLSTTEAEHHAICKGCQSALWIRNLLTEMRVPAKFTLNCDNQGAVKLSWNPEFHQRTSHIPLEEHFVRDEVASGRVETQWVSTEEQLADGLTKSLDRKRHERMMKGMRLMSLTEWEEGCF